MRINKVVSVLKLADLFLLERNACEMPLKETEMNIQESLLNYLRA